jgi:hypothetical protein
MFRSLDRCLMRRNTGWHQRSIFRSYINKLDNERLYSLGYRARSAPVRYRQQSQFPVIVHYYRCTNQHKYSISNQSRQDSMNTAAAIAQELSLLNPTQNHRQLVVNSPICFIQQ